MRKIGYCIFIGSLAGCISPEPPSIHSQDPDLLVPAIKIAVRHHDLGAAPFLVHDLESDDAAVRMYAIDGLRRLTHEDFGYVYYADEDQRRPAVNRWKQWIGQQKT